MKTFLFIICLSLLCNLPSTAQGTETSEASETTTPESPKWEVAVDVLGWIHYGNLPSSIFVRKNFTSKNGKPSALRFRLGFDGRYSDNESSLNYSGNLIDDDNQDYYIRPYARIGYEKQRFLSEKLSFFYGMDTHVSYAYSEHNFESVSTDDFLRERENKNHTLSLGLIPVIGFKQKIGKHFYVSAEATASFIYDRVKWESESVYIDAPERNYNTETKSNRIRSKITPLSVINVGVMW